MTTPPTVLLLTCEHLSRDDTDSPLLSAALADRGVRARTVRWDRADLADEPGVADLAVIRSTWDYTARLPEFLAALDSLVAAGVPVLNALPVVHWNAHKGYLISLADSGVPVVPTALVPQGTADVAALARWPQVIVKPAVSAGARGVARFPGGSAGAGEHLRALSEAGDVLVQPFLPEVADGERSLVFVDGHFTHAVRKQPADGEFRVQEQHGGTNHPVEASPADLRLADLALAAVPAETLAGSGLLYARVDVVGPVDVPLLMELELIEPGLFLELAQAAVDRMADAIIARLANARAAPTDL